jgi:hypothetical protein
MRVGGVRRTECWCGRTSAALQACVKGCMCFLCGVHAAVTAAVGLPCPDLVCDVQLAFAHQLSYSTVAGQPLAQCGEIQTDSLLVTIVNGTTPACCMIEST